MIERQFVSQNMKEYLIQEYIAKTLTNVGLSHTKLMKTPTGIKIIIYASRPGLIVGRKGANIKDLTQTMKSKFKLENPQIEIADIENINLDPQIVAEKIVSTMERFGTQRFKGIAHKVLSDVMSAGARGIEIVVSGKIPSARAKRWRFSAGYLKKCGDIAMNFIKKAVLSANLKSGTVGVQVKIMPPDVELPDDIKIYDETKMEENAAQEKKIEEEKEAKKKGKPNKIGEQKPRREHKKEGHKQEARTRPEQAVHAVQRTQTAQHMQAAQRSKAPEQTAQHAKATQHAQSPHPALDSGKENAVKTDSNKAKEETPKIIADVKNSAEIKKEIHKPENKTDDAGKQGVQK